MSSTSATATRPVAPRTASAASQPSAFRRSLSRPAGLPSSSGSRPRRPRSGSSDSPATCRAAEAATPTWLRRSRSCSESVTRRFALPCTRGISAHVLLAARLARVRDHWLLLGTRCLVPSPQPSAARKVLFYKGSEIKEFGLRPGGWQRYGGAGYEPAPHGESGEKLT